MLILLLTDGTVYDTIDFVDKADFVEADDERMFEYEATEDNGNHIYREVTCSDDDAGYAH